MSKVQLYVYDLSRGLAKQMSLALTGKQIDGIWHTSVVVFGREIFFGQGILEARPGTTHHGQPMQIIDCGTTEIDQGTFEEYLASLQDMYTPQAYHLMDFNCNHFTADVVGFLTGGTIPSWISGLPQEFLSTPFGQAMRPQIDAMFRRTAPSEHPVTSPHHPQPRAGPSSLPTPPTSGTSTPSSLAASLLSSVAAQATTAARPTPSPTPPASSLIPVSSSSHFDSILKDHPAVVVNFTNTPGCPPCRAIKPAYESLAAECASSYGSKGARFVEVELGVGEGQSLAGRYGVSATPTFMFFRGGKKVDEMRGATKRELEARVETFLEDTFPRHAHRKAYLPALESLSTIPVTSANAPAYPALLSKLESFGADQSKIEVLRNEVVPALQGGQTPDGEMSVLLSRWSAVSADLVSSLKPEQVFPLVDLWRIGLVKPRISTGLALALSPTARSSLDPLSPLLDVTTATIKANGSSTPKPLLLTMLRLLTNLLASLPLSNLILSTPHPSPQLAKMQEQIIEILVDSLLHADAGVRTAAGGVAVNLAGWRHRRAKEVGKGADEGEGAEWEVEAISAVVEGIGREEDEDVAHRLLVALGLLIYLSPRWDGEIHPLLELIDAKEMLQRRSKEWNKKEVKKLAEELVTKVL